MFDAVMSFGVEAVEAGGRMLADPGAQPSVGSRLVSVALTTGHAAEQSDDRSRISDQLAELVARLRVAGKLKRTDTDDSDQASDHQRCESGSSD